MNNTICIATEISSHDLAREVKDILSGIPDISQVQWQDGMGEKGGLATERKPDIILVEDDAKLGPIAERLTVLGQNFPPAVIFVISPDPRPEHIVGAMKAGAREYLVSPITKRTLENAVEEVRVDLADSGKMARGKVFSFIGSKGGLGTTLISVNAAIALAGKFKGAVSMVDMSWQSGDSSVLLDLPAEKGFAELSENFHRLDVALLKGVMQKHTSGIEYLGAPFKPELCEEIEPEHVEKTLSLLKKVSDQVVIDCSSMFINDCAMEAFKLSSKVIVVTELFIPAIRNTVRLLKLLHDVGIPQQRIEVVINRFVKNGSLSIEEAEKSIKKRIFWLFPNDHHDVITSINRGIPLVKLLPHSHFSTNMLSFCDHLLRPQKNPEYRGLRGVFGQAL